MVMPVFLILRPLFTAFWQKSLYLFTACTCSFQVVPSFYDGRCHVRVTVRGRGLHHQRGPRAPQPSGEAAQAPVRHWLPGVGALHLAGLCQAKVPREGRPESHPLHDPTGRAAAQASAKNAL